MDFVRLEIEVLRKAQEKVIITFQRRQRSTGNIGSVGSHADVLADFAQVDRVHGNTVALEVVPGQVAVVCVLEVLLSPAPGECVPLQPEPIKSRLPPNPRKRRNHGEPTKQRQTEQRHNTKQHNDKTAQVDVQ